MAWLILCNVPLEFAEAQDSSRRTRSTRSSVGEMLWRGIAEDSGGRVSLVQGRERVSEWFQRLDPGRSERVDQSEFLKRFSGIVDQRAARSGRRSGSSLNRFLGLFVAIDANEDRVISGNEWERLFQSLFVAAAGQSEWLDRDRFVANVEAKLPRTNLTGMGVTPDHSPSRRFPDPPASPVLSTEDSLATLQLASGFRVELAAEEPLIEDPVAFTFDPAGRMYVVEMRSFMLDVDGGQGKAPISRISLLEDVDQDGRFDRASRFLEGLIEPRAALATRDGLLYVTNYQLFFARDIDGDGRADSNQLIDPDYGRGNVEHAPNGLMLAMDNWIYNAKSRVRYRWVGNELLRQETEFRGQWGMTQDNQGRLFYNINNSQLLGDYSPPNYMGRNPNHPSTAGLNLYVATDQRVFPVRMNTAVNRGYLPDVLDERGRLYVFASSCSPVIYRGNTYGAEFLGNAFVCGPAANLVKRNFVFNHDLGLSSRFAYPDREFLASTDERFRPVGLINGPDGNLWLLDMYRGISQYGLFMSQYLREESLKRNLDKGIHLGRIFRITRPPSLGRLQGDLSALNEPSLVRSLAHPNGWVRDAAQALLVERGNRAILPQLIRSIASGKASWERLHALWAVEGISMRTENASARVNSVPDLVLVSTDRRNGGLLSREGAEFDEAFATILETISSDPHAGVQVGAIRVAENLARGKRERQDALTYKLIAALPELPLDAVFQAVLSAGELPRPESFPILQGALRLYSDTNMIREAALSGLGGWELTFAQVLLSDADWRQASPGKRGLLHALASAIVRGGDSTELEILFSATQASIQEQDWKAESLLTGLAEGFRSRGATRIRFGERPRLLDLSFVNPPEGNGSLREELLEKIAWPGYHWEAAEDLAVPVSQNLVQGEGRELFVGICAGCHGMNGEGVKPVAPPVRDSEWVNGAPERLVQIILHGMQGPVVVNGKNYEVPAILPEMPPLSVLDDGQIAAIANYLRSGIEGDHTSVGRDLVSRERLRSKARTQPWEATELEKIP